MTFSIREPIRQWLERIDAAVTALQTGTSGLVPSSGEKAALAGTSGTPGSGNKFVTDGDPRVPSQGENDALVGSFGTPSSSNKFVTSTDPVLLGGTHSVSQYYGNPMIEPPASPGSLDDEFEGGSADLATRGWTVKNSANTTMTRVGDIAPWNNATGLSASQYNSTIYGSTIFIQVALGTEMRIYKAVSWASGSGSVIWARCGAGEYRSGAATQTNVVGVSSWYSSGGSPDGNNKLLSQVSSQGTTGAVFVQTGRVTAGSPSVTGANSSPAAADIYGIKLLSGTTSWDCFIADSKTGALATDSTGTMISTSMAFAGVDIFATATTGAATANSQIFSIDFVRSGSGASAWIAQTPRTRYMLT